MKWLPALLLLSFTVSLDAAVYKYVNENGEVVYSDKPVAGAEQLKLKELSTYTPPPVPLIKSGEAPVKSDVYNSLKIIKPQQESTIRNNLGVIELQLQIDPALKARDQHRIQYYLDNERYGPLVDKTSIMMSNIERGEHTLSASVFDRDGKEIITSPAVTVFLKRESILHPRQGSTPRATTGTPTIKGVPTMPGIPTTPATNP